MKKLYRLQYLVIAFLSILKFTPTSGQTLSANYFRSVKSGSWDSPSVWEVSGNGVDGWSSATTAPDASSYTIIIRSTHIVSITNNVTVDEVVVANGGILELATSSSTLLTVNDGAGSDIIVQNGGVFKHNIASNSSLPSFIESASLEIQQGGILEVSNNNGVPANYANTNSATAAHISFNDGAIFNWNNISNPTAGVSYFPTSPAIPVFRISQTVSIGGTNPTVINGLLEANADINFQSSGTKTFRNGISGTGKVGVTAINSGQFIINGPTASLGGLGLIQLSNKGLLISNTTTLTLNSDKSISNFPGSSSTITMDGTLNAGGYTISGDSKIQINGTAITTNPNGLSGRTNSTFTTATGFTVNSPGASSTIKYNLDGVQSISPLSYANLVIAGSGVKTAASGADISVLGTLSILAGNTFALNGTDNLKLNSGGILNIGANAVFDNGGESQVSGGGTPLVNIYGTFITRDAQGFSGTNTAIPGAIVNIFDGSTIEYARTGDQIVSPRDDYRNLTFSGSGIKTIPTCRPIGTVTIKDNVVADASNKTFGDTTATNLVMTGGRFKVGGTGTKPDISGTYNLTGGVIEFTNSGATKQTIRSTPIYWNIEVSGTNVTNSVSTTKLANGGSFTVKTGGIYDNNADNIVGTIQGIESFIMEAGSTFKTGVKGGFLGNDSSAIQNIDKIIIDPKSTIIYSRGANQTITSLIGSYPSLLLKGSGTKTLASGTLTIASTADSVVIDPQIVLKVNTGAKIDFQNRPVFIRSNATGTGMIGEIADGSSGLANVGNVTVERFIPARRSYRFLSPAVTTTRSIKDNWMEGAVNPDIYTKSNPKPGYGTNITGKDGSANNFDPTITNNPSLFIFNATSQKWECLFNTNDKLLAGSGYRLMVRGDRSIDMTQSDNNPTPTNTILRTTGTLYAGTFSPVLSSVVNGYTFIGNPYASSVDFLKMIKMNSSNQVTGTAYNIKPEYTIWDPKLSRRGSYVTFNAATGKNSDISEVNQHIQPGQAFFVQTVGPDPKLQFDEVYKSTTQTKVFRDPSLKTKLSVQLLLSLEEGMNNTADGVAILFDETFSNGIGNEDSHKFANLDENIAIERNGLALSIEGRSPISLDDTIPLRLWQFKQKSYYFKISGKNFLPEVTAYLKDNYTRQETPIDLSSSTSVSFSIDTTNPSSFSTNRFSIILKSGRTLPVTLTNVSAFVKDDGIEVEWITHNEMNIKKYEVETSVDGKDFKSAGTIAAKNDNSPVESYKWFDENTNTGNNYYRIKITEKSGEVKYSKIVNVNLSKGKPEIIISPNPIMGNIINLRLKNMEKGTYKLNVYNNLGENVYRTIIKHDLLFSYSLKPLILIPKGVYHLSLTQKDDVIYKTLIFE